MALISVLQCTSLLISLTASSGQAMATEGSTNVAGRPLIILAAPRKSDPYPHYQDRFATMINFYINYTKSVMGKDNILLIADAETMPYFKKAQLPSDILVTATIKDIWMRDTGTVLQNHPVKVRFQPNYGKSVSKGDGNSIDISVMKFFTDMGVTFINQQSSAGPSNGLSQYQIPHYPNLILDGGNVVDNKIDKAVITDRVFKDNKDMPKEQIKALLQTALGLGKISIISESKGDTTGHSDGMLSFIDTNTLAIASVDEPEKTTLWNELKTSFGNEVKLIELPSFYNDHKDNSGFTSACGAHANSIVTNDYIYVPTFGQDPEAVGKGYSEDNDNLVLKIIANNTAKTVVPIPVPYKLCMLGGSVRCLSTQISGPIADMLIEKAKTASG